MKTDTHNKTRKITLLAMLSAIAYIFTLLGHFVPIQFNDFLRYDPKDAIIAVSGFVLGPLSALIVSVVVALLELVTISTTGFIGCLMNIISSASFACVAALIYKGMRSIKGATLGLILSSLLTVGLMLLWNFLITPHYMKVPQAAVNSMLLPVFLPFNAIKCGLNSSLTMIIYKPFVNAMRKVGLIPKKEKSDGHIKIGLIVVCLILIALLVALFLLFKNT